MPFANATARPSAVVRAVAPRDASHAVLLAVALAGLPAAHAQTAPDAGSLLRESQQPPPRVPELPPLPQPKLLQDTGVRVTVKRFVVSGSTRFPAARFDALLADLVDKELGFAQLQAAADRVATLYREAGLHATAYLPEQTLADGTLRIVVVEGRFGRLRVETDPASTRAKPLALIERMLSAGQTRGEMLDGRALERATLIANEIPGVRVSAVLAPGETAGETDVIARVDDRAVVSGAATLDNSDPRATGSAQAGLALSISGWAGFGEQLQVNGNVTEGKRYLRGAVAMPLGASGLRGTLNASRMTYELKGEFAASGARGSAETVGAALALPLWRGVERNLVATATFDRRHLVNDSTAGNLSDKTIRVASLGVNGDATDTFNGGGAWVGGATLTAGRVDLSGNADDLAADAVGPLRNGRYTKLAANLGRLQRLSTRGALWLSVSGQYAANRLDSNEKFSLGGSQGVRAYPSLEGSGDHGVLATVEYRHRVNDALQLSTFYDHGEVVRDKHPFAGTQLPNHYALKGVGVGVEWNFRDRVVVKAALATRVGDNPAASANGSDSDGTKRRPRAWLSVSLPF